MTEPGGAPPSRRGVDAAESAEELYEEAPCGYLTTRPDGTIVRINGTFLRWTGLARDELVGRRRFQDLLTPGGRIYHETHFAPLLRMQGAVREIALEVVCVDGRRLPVLVNSTLRQDGEGHPLSVRTVVFDATDRRRYEAELLAARERERAARERMAVLVRATHALGEHVEPKARAEALVALLVPELGDWANVRVDDGPKQAFQVSAGERDVDADSERRIAVPLRVGVGWTGMLEVVRSSARAPFDDEDRLLANELGDRAGLALGIALMLEEQRGVAHELQISLLADDFPDVSGVTFGACYHPGVEALEVGGDFYDAVQIAPGHLALVVGDVVGRGLHAASAMGQLRSAIRALALAGHEPGRVLDDLDRFVEHATRCRYATVTVAALDVAAHHLTFACAGHPPPLILSNSLPAAFAWDGRSAPLGLPPREGARPQAELQLPRTATVLLYTDGLIEIRREPIDHGLARLADEVHRVRDLCPQHLIDTATTRILTGHSAHDDICALCIRLNPPDPGGS
jgi:PAS domain S-box-containing protein